MIFCPCIRCTFFAYIIHKNLFSFMISHNIFKCLFWFIFGLSGKSGQVLTTHDSIGVVGEGEDCGYMYGSCDFQL